MTPLSESTTMDLEDQGDPPSYPTAENDAPTDSTKYMLKAYNFSKPVFDYFTATPVKPAQYWTVEKNKEKFQDYILTCKRDIRDAAGTIVKHCFKPVKLSELDFRTLRRHIKTVARHSEDLKELDEKEKKGLPSKPYKRSFAEVDNQPDHISSAPLLSTQTSDIITALKASVSATHFQRVWQKCLQLLVYESLPLGFLESPAFIDLLSELGVDSQMMRSRRSVTKDLQQWYVHECLILYARFVNVPSISLIVDLWESPDRKATWFAGIIAVFTEMVEDHEGHQVGVKREVLLAMEPMPSETQTGSDIAHVVKKVTDSIGISSKIAMITADGAANNLTFLQIFRELVKRDLIEAKRLELRSQGLEDEESCLLDDEIFENYLYLPFHEERTTKTSLTTSSLNVCLAHVVNSTVKSTVRAIDITFPVGTVLVGNDGKPIRKTDGSSSKLRSTRLEEITYEKELKSQVDICYKVVEKEHPELFDGTQEKFMTLNAQRSIEKLRAFVKIIQRNHGMKYKYLETCLNCGLTPKLLPTDIQTRWSSLFRLVSVAFEYRSVIEMFQKTHMKDYDPKDSEKKVSPLLTTDDWWSLRFVFSLLAPFAELTNICSTTDSHIGQSAQVFLQLDGIISAMENGTLMAPYLPGSSGAGRTATDQTSDTSLSAVDRLFEVHFQQVYKRAGFASRQILTKYMMGFENNLEIQMANLLWQRQRGKTLHVYFSRRGEGVDPKKKLEGVISHTLKRMVQLNKVKKAYKVYEVDVADQQLVAHQHDVVETHTKDRRNRINGGPSAGAYERMVGESRLDYLDRVQNYSAGVMPACSDEGVQGTDHSNSQPDVATYRTITIEEQCETELEMFLGMETGYINAVKGLHPIDFWGSSERIAQFPLLSSIGMELFVNELGSVKVERLFSVARNTYKLRRSMLLPSNVSMLMMLKDRMNHYYTDPSDKGTLFALATANHHELKFLHTYGKDVFLALIKVPGYNSSALKEYCTAMKSKENDPTSLEGKDQCDPGETGHAIERIDLTIFDDDAEEILEARTGYGIIINSGSNVCMLDQIEEIEKVNENPVGELLALSLVGTVGVNSEELAVSMGVTLDSALHQELEDTAVLETDTSDESDYD